MIRSFLRSIFKKKCCSYVYRDKEPLYCERRADHEGKHFAHNPATLTDVYWTDEQAVK